MTTERIDVLAELDAASAALTQHATYPSDVKFALARIETTRAAVAELIEAHNLQIDFYDGYCLTKPNGERFGIDRYSTEFEAQQAKDAAIAAALARVSGGAA